ncbi:MAG: helix-turn-helix domain-containing protein [Flavisolibacter sp.]
MNLSLVTREEFQLFKSEILEEIRSLAQPQTHTKEWLKSADVMQLLNCSPGTLQNLRVNGTLPYTKVGGTLYYSHADVMAVLNSNKRNAA